MIAAKQNMDNNKWAKQAVNNPYEDTTSPKNSGK